MIFLKKPEDFDPKVTIASCFLERDGKFLLLHRCDNKFEGNTWGVPAGKVERGESISTATARELFEETGVMVPVRKIIYWRETFVRYPDFDFVYHVSSVPCPQDAVIKNQSERT